ncbi:threonine ammonia-lyase IlvA [Parapedobacter indicus]|uniref:L-threonine dehydratase n=1 Tax=Parapedobacter indicus TaxID=1477437 RepID=A0A1I3H0L6_9SPHI|nr:threonine ammonia-lyase IlvA [Parapedobacter indicus]PPL02856.1 L-threonine ammonia-lyase [Parapedobacter indicus]SFI29249.1 L-threonine ammonia-lyase [Parapedobacter indicus]
MIEWVESASRRLTEVVAHTPLQYSQRLSEKYRASIYLKREDLQVVRSYKLRGAFNKISLLSEADRKKGVVCASAGNHAQGVAFSCKRLGIRGVIFMPEPTPRQKISQTEMFGQGYIEIVLTGDTFDDCQRAALAYANGHDMTFVHPFDDPAIIEGQGTVGMEILQDQPETDLVIIPIGGGGLAAGAGTYLKEKKPGIRIYGVEPEGAPSMKTALEHGGPVTLAEINRFVDGAAVKRIGDLTYQYCSKLLDDMHLIPEGKICTTILELYNKDAIVAEPAGALAVAALDFYADQIIGKNVVCIISGGNNDIDRMGEIKELSLLYEGLKHYFIVRFPQRPGALKLFVNEVLGPHDDITRFEFIKKTQRERGPALVGVELQNASDYTALVDRMRTHRFDFKEVNSDQTLFEYLI